MRYVLSEDGLQRLRQMGRDIDALMSAVHPQDKVSSPPRAENPSASPYPFQVISYQISGEWWAEVTNGKPWDSSGYAGVAHVQQMGGTELTVNVSGAAFYLGSGERLYLEVFYSPGGAGAAVLKQSSGIGMLSEWPYLLSGLASGTLINWPIAFAASGTGEVNQKHVGDVRIPILGVGGGGICVVVTSSVAYNHYLCSVYGNGYRDDGGTPVAVTETGKDLWIDQIAAASVVPNGTMLRATKIGTHYEAEVPRWL